LNWRTLSLHAAAPPARPNVHPQRLHIGKDRALPQPVCERVELNHSRQSAGLPWRQRVYWYIQKLGCSTVGCPLFWKVGRTRCIMFLIMLMINASVDESGGMIRQADIL